MDKKEIQKKILDTLKPYLKGMANIFHYLPPGPIIALIFDVILPLRLRGKEFPKLKDEETDFQIIFSGMPGTRKWALIIDKGRASIRRGEIDYPHTIINAEARAFIDTVTGRVAPEKALMAGKVTLTGPAAKMKIIQSLLG